MSGVPARQTSSLFFMASANPAGLARPRFRKQPDNDRGTLEHNCAGAPQTARKHAGYWVHCRTTSWQRHKILSQHSNHLGVQHTFAFGVVTADDDPAVTADRKVLSVECCRLASRHVERFAAAVDQIIEHLFRNEGSMIATGQLRSASLNCRKPMITVRTADERHCRSCQLSAWVSRQLRKSSASGRNPQHDQASAWANAVCVFTNAVQWLAIVPEC